MRTFNVAGPDLQVPKRMRIGVLAALVLAFLAATGATYMGAARLFETQAASVARSQHALYLRSLNQAFEQHQHLPFVLSQNPDISRRIADGDMQYLNGVLEEFAAASGLEAIYVMTLDGDVVAASNHASAGSFLGQNYGFRPYFQGAAGGARSDYFAIGATTGRPGYFVAEPLHARTGDLIGVIAIKLDISELQHAWEERGEHVLATNADGIVVLASDPAWLYHAISDLDPDRRAEITRSRQFGRQPLEALAWETMDDNRVTLLGETYAITSGRTVLLNWSVHYLTPEATFLRQTLFATAIIGALIAVLIGFAAFVRSRRIEAALALSQRHRQELVEANALLVNAQNELAQSSKLAALGQLAASVTHELGQPISALKNHLFAAEIGNEITSKETLGSLHRLVDRMEAITKQLRFFARRPQDEMEAIDIATVVSEALGLLQHDFEAAGVDIHWTAPDTPFVAQGNQLQLEQAMVNLLRNALDASKGEANARITVDCVRAEGRLKVRVLDSGPGLEGQSIEALQEPFFSTRSSGDGMGLGLAITTEIIRAHGGALSAQDAPEGGAVFEISLPDAREGEK
ncbi:MAG: ATP-binding protein [Pseudomonadota bacterium]